LTIVDADGAMLWLLLPLLLDDGAMKLLPLAPLTTVFDVVVDDGRATATLLLSPTACDDDDDDALLALAVEKLSLLTINVSELRLSLPSRDVDETTFIVTLLSFTTLLVNVVVGAACVWLRASIIINSLDRLANKNMSPNAAREERNTNLRILFDVALSTPVDDINGTGYNRSHFPTHTHTHTHKRHVRFEPRQGTVLYHVRACEEGVFVVVVVTAQRQHRCEPRHDGVGTAKCVGNSDLCCAYIIRECLEHQRTSKSSHH
jgi:hypothetical protein